jgi:L-asparaginase II
VFCIAEPSRGVGIAIKVISGCGEALPAAIVHVLDALTPGAFAPPEPWGHRQVRNVVGDVVGGFEVA